MGRLGGLALIGFFSWTYGAELTVKVMPDAPLLLSNPRDGWDVAIGATALGIAAVGDDVAYDVAILGTLAGESGSSSS